MFTLTKIFHPQYLKYLLTLFYAHFFQLVCDLHLAATHIIYSQRQKHLIPYVNKDWFILLTTRWIHNFFKRVIHCHAYYHIHELFKVKPGGLSFFCRWPTLYYIISKKNFCYKSNKTIFYLTKCTLIRPFSLIKLAEG